MLKKIKVYGTLRKFLGQSEFEVDLNTPREAISFLKCNFLGILLGVGALFGGSAVAAGTTFLGSGLLATVVSGALTSIGTSMVVDGVTSMLSPQQSNLSPTGQDALDPAALASNYSFTGLTNISRAGVPVNLVYGEIVVGSIVVSNGVDTVQVEGNN